jgi:hypothetical protein
MLLTSGSDDGDIGGGCSGAHGWTLRGAIWTGLGLGAIHRRVDRAVQPRPGWEGLINPSPCLGIRLSALGCHLAPLIPIKEKDHDRKEREMPNLIDRRKKHCACEACGCGFARPRLDCGSRAFVSTWRRANLSILYGPFFSSTEHVKYSPLLVCCCLSCALLEKDKSYSAHYRILLHIFLLLFTLEEKMI